MKGTTIFCVLLVLHITTGFGQPPPWELADLWAPGPWTRWSACSTSCGLGTRQRTRVCRSLQTLLPTCPDEIKLHSKHIWKQTVKCKRSCPVFGQAQRPRTGLWEPGPWTPWSACSTSCGLGTRQRTRVCRDFYTYQPTCPDEFKLHSNYVWKQTVKCKKRSCPVDGGWAEWAEWSECSQNCREE